MNKRNKVKITSTHLHRYEQYSGVAINTAKAFCGVNKLPRGMNFEDVVQIAQCGLWMAILGWNKKKSNGCKFLSYAMVYVRGYIRNSVMREDGFPLYYYNMRGKSDKADKAWAVHLRIREIKDDVTKTEGETSKNSS